jgi:hypothetical protein
MHVEKTLCCIIVNMKSESRGRNKDALITTYSHSSVSSTISVDGTALTAFTKLFHATLLSLVSVKYDHGGLNRDGFRTALVLTPLAVAETLDNRPSVLYFRNSSVQVTTVRDGLVSVLHPRLPAEVGALFVGMFCAAAVVSAALAHDAPDCRSIVDCRSIAVEQILLSISRRLLLIADGLLLFS